MKMEKFTRGFKHFLIYLFAGILIIIFFIGSSISINYNFDRTKDRSKSTWQNVLKFIKEVKDVLY